MNLLYLILRLLTSANIEECLACSWPYRSQLNSQDECVPLYEYQDELEVSCYAFCATWQNRADTQQTVTPIWTFINADPFASTSPVCKCVRLNKGAYVSYIDRPQNVCRYGASDYVNNYRDTSTQQIQQTEAIRQIEFSYSYGTRMDTLRQIFYNMTGGYGVQSGWMPGMMQSQTWDCFGNTVYFTTINQKDADISSKQIEVDGNLSLGQGDLYNSEIGYIGLGTPLSGGQRMNQKLTESYTSKSEMQLPPGFDCMDVQSGGATVQLREQMAYNAGQFRRQDSANAELMNSMEAVAKQIQSNGEAQIQQMNTNDSMLLYRINSTAGGGQSTDLTPVTDAVNALRNYIANKDSTDNASIGELATELSDSIGSAIAHQNQSVDTGAIINNLKQSTFNPLTSAWSIDSAGLRSAVNNQTTCTDFPDDPEITLTLFQDEQITIPLSSYHDKLNMIRTMLKWAAIVTAALIYIGMVTSMFSLNTSNK